MKYKEFNLNQNVRVKLTDKGFVHMKAHHDAIYNRSPSLHKYKKPIEEYRAQADDDGYIRLQAWEFMEIFGGDVCGLAKPQLFDVHILIDEVNLRDPK